MAYYSHAAQDSGLAEFSVDNKFQTSPTPTKTVSLGKSYQSSATPLK
jgi:hypothetical protein